MQVLRILKMSLPLFLLIGCSGKGGGEYDITIAEQYGLAYAPVQIMRAKGFLEEENPRIRAEWVRLGNTAAIREAVLSGHVDAGFMGIPPFLIACDKGMTWKISSGLSRSPLGLTVNNSQIGELSDFPEKGYKLALPQPGSIQHILLSLYLRDRYGDPHMLDGSLVSMNHPDGLAALLSGAVAGHFTSPPYLFQEMGEPGFSLLLTGEEAAGSPFSFIVGMVTEEFARDRSDLFRDYSRALEKSVDFIYSHRVETLDILSKEYGLEPSLLNDYLYTRGMEYDLNVQGLEIFLDFMREDGLITSDLNMGDILLETP